MPKPYDATTKWLIDHHPEDWLKLLGLSVSSAELLDVEALDTDLATVIANSDRVFRVHLPSERLQHMELESGHHGAKTPAGLLRFSVLLTSKYGLPVNSTVILLRREADSPALTGQLEYLREDGSPYLVFEYNIVRVWEIPAEVFLTGGLGTLPLAPIARVSPEQLPEIVRDIEKRIEDEAGAESGELWTAIKVLMGLRYSRQLTGSLLKRIRYMRESVTYREIVEEGEAIGEARGRTEGRVEGRAEEARAIFMRIAQKRLGALPVSIAEHISALTSPEEIEQLVERVIEIESWSELLPGRA